MATCSYFLGANTANGFYSCYDSFCPPEGGCFLWIIKGGPGCGKSTLMRKIGAAAEAAGLDVEYVLCSGDPDSLDGVYLPQKEIAFTDGTAPHVQEPAYPGVSGAYLDLGRFYDAKALSPLRKSFVQLTAAYRAKYAEAYKALASVLPVVTEHELPENGKRRRFRTAITCKGVVTTNPSKLCGDRDVQYLHPLLPEYPDPEDRPSVLPDCSTAIEALKAAKALHDELEALYRPHVDFSGLDEETERILKMIFQNGCQRAKNDVE